MLKIIAVILSQTRPGVDDIIRTTLQQPFHEIHVFGYVPSDFKINTSHPPNIITSIYHHPSIPRTWYHRALDHTLFDHTPSILCTSKYKNCESESDTLKKLKWRATIVLNAWAILSQFKKSPHHVVYLENDAFFTPQSVKGIYNYFNADPSTPASCYNPTPLKTYTGYGAVCFMFPSKFILGNDVNNYKNNQQSLKALLSYMLLYHLVQPIDWIWSDFANLNWGAYHFVLHGNPNNKHKSTF